MRCQAGSSRRPELYPPGVRLKGMSWYDLTQPFHPEIPHSRGLPSPAFETLKRVDEDGVNVQRFETVTHVGTHVDAPLHFYSDGATIDELPLERFAGPGLVADVGQTEPGEIPLAEFRAAVDDAGGLEAGDILLVRTGWGRYFDDEDDERYQRYPWLASEIAEWLVESEIKLLGVDTISPDKPRLLRAGEYNEYAHHRTLLAEGIPIAEHLFLEEVAGKRLEIVGFPMKLRGGDGAPIRIGARESREKQ